VAGALDALVVAVWFTVAGIVGALVWWQVVTLPKVMKVGNAAARAPEELVKQVGIDGWFFVIAAVGGLLSGVLLLIWRWRDPLLMVGLAALGAGLASWLMIHVGLALGPGEEIAALRGMKDGAEVPMQLKLAAPGMAWIWSIFAVLGAIIYVWILRKPDDEEP
jgi:membrane associated rhomboid family serine protease